MQKKKSKGGTLKQKNHKFFFSLKLIKNSLKVVLNQFDADLEEKFFCYGLAKQIIRVPVAQHMNDIKIKIFHSGRRTE